MQIFLLFSDKQFNAFSGYLALCNMLSALKKLYLNGCRPFETLSPVFVMSSLKRFRRTVAHLRSPSSEK
jgi:hypothetical protein